MGKVKELDFLNGPTTRRREFWNVLGIAKEFIKGFRTLHFVGPCISVFGSARTKESDPYYQAAVSFGEAIAKSGFATMTGGGPGIMEAANRGARQGGGKSIGVNIELPMEQHPNPYLDVSLDMKQFYVRKVLLLKYAHALVVMPGGFGTLDELFETITLIQTKKIEKIPIVLFGSEYWKKMFDFVDVMELQSTISPEDKHLMKVTDSVEEGMSFIISEIQKKPDTARRKPNWFLGEQS